MAQVQFRILSLIRSVPGQLFSPSKLRFWPHEDGGEDEMKL